jgi:hypothetical protein
MITYLTATPLNLLIEPEFITGILAGSSITLGLWIFVASESAEDRGYGRTALVLNLIIFVAGIFFLFLSILGLLPMLITLCTSHR